MHATSWIILQDKRPTYEEWAAEHKRVKQEQQKKALSAADEEELARAWRGVRLPS